jgi:hypothetical protein
MLLVPRQLLRAGMTGDVPYYGGRLSPAQAYAASHPSARPSGSGRVVDTTRAEAGDPRAATSRAVPPTPPTGNEADVLLSLQHLLDAGVITPEEYTGLRARLGA